MSMWAYIDWAIYVRTPDYKVKLKLNIKRTQKTIDMWSSAYSIVSRSCWTESVLTWVVECEVSETSVKNGQI